MRLFSIITLTMTLLIYPVDDSTGSTTSIQFTSAYATEELQPCSSSSVKTYMSYKSITNKQSTQYKFIQGNLEVDEETGLLMDSDGFIAVALGSYFGEIGTRYLIQLESGQILKLIKAEQKSDNDTISGCKHESDNSVIEFLVDKKIAGSYFGISKNGLILSGNFNNHEDFKGRIVKIDQILAIQIRSMPGLIEKPAEVLYQLSQELN